MKSTIIGYPRIGAKRELKFAVESYLKENIDAETLHAEAKKLRENQWIIQKDNGIDLIPSNDFSYYDNLLDTAFLLNVIPKRYSELKLSPLDTYFALARGYQKGESDVKALPMKKWFNTNYHYIVPEINDDTNISLNATTPIDLYKEAKSLGIETKPVIIGPFTFLKLTQLNTTRSFEELLDQLVDVYSELFTQFDKEEISYLQIDEPILVTDLSKEDITLFKKAYEKLLSRKYSFQAILQTYFGDVRDVYEELQSLPVDAIGLDFIEGYKNIELIKKHGFAKDKVLFAGIINGKNIWRNDYKKSLETISELKKYVDEERIVINSSCSLLHSPYTTQNETKLADSYKESLAFAQEKLAEFTDIAELLADVDHINNEKYTNNQAIIERKRSNAICLNNALREKVAQLTEADFNRIESFDDRRAVQKEELKLPLLPTTTIGSFPQTQEVKRVRKNFREGIITEEQYENEIKARTKEIIEFQEEIDLDVLVHGEYERTDMVEYFGKLLEGFLFTENGWVQSYGTRGVKPPVIYGDVLRSQAMTVKWSTFAQSLTEKPVKGMLTGPITILNWSFPREDLDLQSIAYQIGLAIGEEVLDLEEHGIKIIQIDEAALREKLPLRREDWNKNYLDWAIKAFRLTNSKVKKETQIHTHMCYSQFEDIVKEIEAMDVDVISIEAARSDSSLLDFLRENNFKLEIGPGVYDIHSPRVPTQEEMEELVKVMSRKLDITKIWVNPDCGLKTRDMKETKPSLINMVTVAKALREVAAATL